MDPRGASASQAQVETSRSPRTELVTLVFTDIVGSTALKQQLGDKAGAALIQQHHALVREVFQPLADAQEISTAGDSFLIRFAKPSDAVKFALLLQSRLRTFNQGREVAVQDRIGVHLGEVVIAEEQAALKPRDVYGMHVDTCARVMGLAQGGQILLTRAVFDSARQALKGEDIAGVGSLSWLNHGLYQLKGIDEPVEICEVGEVGAGPLRCPATTEKARRVAAAEGEAVLGWRPAVGQAVPNTKWVLEQKLGEGGFGEVWLGRHQTMKERRVFKFCFRADRVRSLKREMTLFRLIKERIGDHPNIVSLREVYFDQPPFYVEMDYAEGQDLARWCAAQGGADKVALEVKLELVAQIADALQAAHEAGVIHRDVKPGNILISGEWQVTSDEKEADPREVTPPRSSLVTRHSSLSAKLTDFGIGQVVSQEYLSGVTKAGFTQTMLASSSSQTGTQLYMAPELLAGKPASTRSDIYSLGVVLYQLLAGDFRRPVATDWANDISHPLLREDLRHCFAGNPQDRFAAAGLLAKNLRSLPQRQAALAAQQAELAARERAAYRRGIIRAGAVAALIVASVAVLAGYAFRQAKRADHNARRAEEQQQRAEDAAGLLRRNVYAADMNVAHHALREGNRGRVVELLRKHLPKAGEEDLRGFEWSYLWEQSRSDALFAFPPHDSAATSVAFSPDGALLATGSFDKIVRLWDVRARKQIRILGPFSGWVSRNALAFSPKGDLFVAANDGELIVWDSKAWKEARRFRGVINATIDDSCPISFSGDGKVIAAKVSSGVALWEVDSGARRLIQGESPDFGDQLCFAPDNEVLAIANGPVVEIWNPRTLSREVRLEGKGGRVVGLALARQTRLLAAGTLDGVVTVWNLAAPSAAGSVNAHARWAFGLAFTPDGKTLATGGADQMIHVWDAPSILTTSTHTNVPPAESGARPLSTLRGHEDQVWALAFSPDGQRLASACKDGEVMLWNAQLGKADRGLKGAWLPLWFSPDGRNLLTVNHDSRLHLCDLTAGTENVLAEISIADPVAQLPTVSADGKRLAFAKSGGEIELWDLIRRQRIGSSATYRGGVSGLQFSPDGHWLAVADGQATTVWNVLTDRVQSPREDVHGVSIAFSPDGTRLAGRSPDVNTPTFDATVQVWDVATAKGQLTLTGHKINVPSVAFSPNGLSLATGGHDNTIRLWDAATGKGLFVLKGHITSVVALAFAQDGKTLASGGTDGTVKLWHVPTSQELFSQQFLPSRVSRLTFSPAGNALAIGFSDATSSMHLLRAKSLAEVDASIEAATKEK